MALQGVVSRWQPGKNFGFITEERSGEQIFVHRSDILNQVQLDVGTKVEFKVDQTEDGRQKAVEVKVTDAQQPAGDDAAAAGEAAPATKAAPPRRMPGARVAGGRTAGGGGRVQLHKGGAVRGLVKKWFNGSGSQPGGYGFVVPQEGEHKGKDIYIHHTAFGGGSLNLGWELHFDVEVDPMKEGRLRAVNAAGDAVCGRGCRMQEPLNNLFHPWKKDGGDRPTRLQRFKNDEDMAEGEGAPEGPVVDGGDN